MKALKDYSFVRGVCYLFDPNFTMERLVKDLELCKRLNINSFRFWLDQSSYEKDPEGYVDSLKKFMEKSWEYGVSSMPIFWNGNFIREYEEPTSEEYTKATKYAEAIINAFHEKEYILMWDVINEPMCNDYMNFAARENYQERYEQLKSYTRRLCEIVRSIDAVNCITVGHEQVKHCESSADLVDVISYHCYQSLRSTIEENIMAAKKIGEQYGKPILNTETGCVGRANPYEIELELADKHKVGWYLFDLLIEGFWGDIHGLVYPDGTIRDPGIIAALFGFYRNRTEDRVKSNPNKECHAYHAVRMVEDALRVEPTTLFMSKPKTTDEILDAAEYCINILESNEMVPMWDLPSAKLLYYRNLPEEKRDVFEIKKFAYDMSQILRKNCLF